MILWCGMSCHVMSYYFIIYVIILCDIIQYCPKGAASGSLFDRNDRDSHQHVLQYNDSI